MTNTKKFDHVTPVLRALQWPSVKSKLQVRDITLLYKIINGLAPAYVASKIGKKAVVTAQGIKISYNLPFEELLPLSVPFLSLNKYLELPLLKL